MQYRITTLISFLTDDSILIPARRTFYFAAAFVNRENKNVNEEHKNKKKVCIYIVYIHTLEQSRECRLISLVTLNALLFFLFHSFPYTTIYTMLYEHTYYNLL